MTHPKTVAVAEPLVWRQELQAVGRTSPGNSPGIVAARTMPMTRRRQHQGCRILAGGGGEAELQALGACWRSGGATCWKTRPRLQRRARLCRPRQWFHPAAGGPVLGPADLASFIQAMAASIIHTLLALRRLQLPTRQWFEHFRQLLLCESPRGALRGVGLGASQLFTNIIIIL